MQPISLTYVHGHEFRAGLEYIRSLTEKPIGFNALIEASNKAYLDRMRRWIDIALEEGVRFFITSLGNPKWVCERVHALGGVVYHDVTERKWAQKGIEGGVDGLIAVNARAGGHAGPTRPKRCSRSSRPSAAGRERRRRRHAGRVRDGSSARLRRPCSSARASSRHPSARRATRTSRRS